MIEVYIDKDTKVFHTKEMALRFMYKMRNQGYFIKGWSADDPWDNEWLNRRFKQ